MYSLQMERIVQKIKITIVILSGLHLTHKYTLHKRDKNLVPNCTAKYNVAI